MTGYAALITGSSRGIGKGIALSLAKKGFAVALNARALTPQLESAREEVAALGVRAVAVPADVRDLDAHDRLLAAAEGEIGPLTTLVNNAGVSVMRRGDLLEVEPESFDRCVGVNARGPFFLTTNWARRLLSRSRPADLHHCVIFVSSVNAVAASVNRGEYCVSKAGASMTARLFAVRLAAEGIGSYEIQPGLIETELSAPAHNLYRRRIQEEGLSLVPRMGQPCDMGPVAAALATGEFRFCTGQTVQADGGLLIPRF